MILAKIYLTMLAGGQKAVTLRVILKNFWVILGAKLFGRRRVQSLLDRLDADVGINPQGIWRAQIDLDASTLYKLKGQRDRAIELLHTARQAAEAQNAAVLLCKIDAELAELNLPTVP